MERARFPRIGYNSPIRMRQIVYCARGLHESISREERLCGVRRPFSFFKDFFLLAALWIRQKLGKN